jgi:hypothetical protein
MSRPVRFNDFLGLWPARVHGQFTDAALRAVDADTLVPPPQAGDELMLSMHLKAANTGQDPLAPLFQHYNRDRDEAPETADRRYGNFIGGLTDRMQEMLNGIPVGTPKVGYAKLCAKVLQYKGMQDHAFQDFFIHAKPRNGGDNDFEAFSKGVKGTPYSREAFWPSAYPASTEHRLLTEPVAEGTAEWKSRFAAAKEFSESDYKTFIPFWWSRCWCLVHLLGKPQGQNL